MLSVLRSTFNKFGTPGTLETIVAPASNTKGIKIFGAFATDNTGTISATTRVMAKASAPTSATDVAANTLAVSGNTTIGMSATGFPVVLPPGVGLYAQSSPGNANASYGVEYEVLA